MTDRIDIARFEELADAFGGVIARWPEPYRAVASQMAAHPAAAAILVDALMLDETLDQWRVPAPTTPLIARVVAGGPAAVRHTWSRLRVWWTGMGFAAALAGAAVGIAAVATVASIEPLGSYSSSENGTSFGDVANQDG